MALKIGRQGYLGIGIESTPGTPVAAVATVPFTTNNLKGHHTPDKDIASRASRAQNFTSVTGKQWGEGEVDVNVDTLNIGYIFKLALGNEVVNTIQTGVYDHLFYTTISGNTPTTATLYNYEGVDVQQFASMAVDKMDVEVKDGLMTAKTSFKGFFQKIARLRDTFVNKILAYINESFKKSEDIDLFKADALKTIQQAEELIQKSKSLEVADNKEVAKVEDAVVAKVEAQISLLKEQMTKILNAPMPPKAKASYMTVEKGFSTGDSAQIHEKKEQLAKAEKRADELHLILKGSHTLQDEEEAKALALDIMQLRREVKAYEQSSN